LIPPEKRAFQESTAISRMLGAETCSVTINLIKEIQTLACVTDSKIISSKIKKYVPPAERCKLKHKLPIIRFIREFEPTVLKPRK